MRRVVIIGCGGADWAFVRWIWGYRRSHRPRVLELIDRHREGRRIYVLRTERQVEALLQGG